MQWCFLFKAHNKNLDQDSKVMVQADTEERGLPVSFLLTAEPQWLLICYYYQKQRDGCEQQLWPSNKGRKATFCQIHSTRLLQGKKKKTLPSGKAKTDGTQSDRIDVPNKMPLSKAKSWEGSWWDIYCEHASGGAGTVRSSTTRTGNNRLLCHFSAQDNWSQDCLRSPHVVTVPCRTMSLQNGTITVAGICWNSTLMAAAVVQLCCHK